MSTITHDKAIGAGNTLTGTSTCKDTNASKYKNNFTTDQQHGFTLREQDLFAVYTYNLTVKMNEYNTKMHTKINEPRVTKTLRKR